MSSAHTADWPCRTLIQRMLPNLGAPDGSLSDFVISIRYAGPGAGHVPRIVPYDEDPWAMRDTIRNEHPDAAIVIQPASDFGSPVAHAQVARATALDGRSVEITGEGLRPDAMEDASADLPDTGRFNRLAISVFVYTAVRPDQIDAEFGDSFRVLDTSGTEWLLERKLLEADGTVGIRQGRLPKGCLLDCTVVPQADGSQQYRIESTYTRRRVLLDYEGIRPEEIQVKAGASVHVYKTMKHWSYVTVGDDQDERGWMPSWLLSNNLDPRTAG